MRTLQRFVDATAGPVAAAGFGAGSFLRRARVFHPVGAAFEATVDVSPGRPAVGPAAFASAGRHRAIVRLSRGAGLPEPVPDFLGFALRVLDAHGPDRHQDLLLVTSGAAAGVRHLLLPAGGYGRAFYSSILPYRCGDQTLMFAAAPRWADGVDPRDNTTARIEDAEPLLTRALLRFELLVATPAEPWQPLAAVDVGRRLSEAEEEGLEFNVFNTGEMLEPAGLLNALRRRAYEGSQRARPGTG